MLNCSISRDDCLQVLYKILVEKYFQCYLLLKFHDDMSLLTNFNCFFFLFMGKISSKQKNVSGIFCLVRIKFQVMNYPSDGYCYTVFASVKKVFPYQYQRLVVVSTVQLFAHRQYFGCILDWIYSDQFHSFSFGL